MKNRILSINADLKYIEFILYIFDRGEDKLTLKEIRKEFKTKFKENRIMLNQNFGIIRLLPLIFIKETYKLRKKELTGDIKKIKIIRDAIAYNSFGYDENGYLFNNDKEEVSMSYEEFQKFLHKIENEFYME
jgi:hypothetical protein